MMGDGHGHREGIHRFGNQVGALLAEMFNFKIHWIRATTWGYLKKDNVTWTGCMGLLQRHEVNYSTADLLYMPPRHPVIDSGLCVFKFR